MIRDSVKYINQANEKKVDVIYDKVGSLKVENKENKN